MTGSRRFTLPDAMSIFALRVRAPSGNSPARIRRRRLRFSSTERFRYGLSRPGPGRGPREALTWLGLARGQPLYFPGDLFPRPSERGRGLPRKDKGYLAELTADHGSGHPRTP